MCLPKIRTTGIALFVLGLIAFIFALIEGILVNPTAVYMISDIYWKLAEVMGFMAMSLGLGIIMFDRLEQRLINLESKIK